MKKATSFAGLFAALLSPAVVWTQSRQRMEDEGRPLWPAKEVTPSAPRGQIPHSEKLRLAGLLRDIYLIHDSSDTPLSKTQCRAMFSALRPWLKRPHMTDNEALALNEALRKLLTAKQLLEQERQRQMRMVFTPVLDRAQEEELAREEKPMLAYLAAFNPVRPLAKDKAFRQLPEPLRQRIESRCALNTRLIGDLKNLSTPTRRPN